MKDQNDNKTQDWCEVMREELFEQAFTKQKNNCIQAFKALGEENRLIHVLNEIEREKLTYKAYFKVGYECCKTEVDELQKRVDALEKAEFKLAQVKAILQNNPKLLESILVKKIEQALKGGES